MLGDGESPRIGPINSNHVPGRRLVGITDETVERRPIPYQIGTFHCIRIAVIWQRTSLAPDNLVQAWSEAIVTFLQRVAGTADIVERELTIIRRGDCGLHERAGRNEGGNPQCESWRDHAALSHTKLAQQKITSDGCGTFR